MGIIFAVLLLVLGIGLLIARKKGWIGTELLNDLVGVSSIVSMMAAVVVLLFSYPWLLEIPSPSASTPTPTAAAFTPAPIVSTPSSTPPSIPTPRKEGRVSLFDDFTSQRNWTEGNDQNGKSWYGDGGYYVVSFDSVGGWVWVLPKRVFTLGTIEIDATPITHGSVTGYGILVGWEKANNYYMFENRPDGQCGFVRVLGQVSFTDFASVSCTPPIQGKTDRIRLEITGKQMVAFLNGEYVAEQTFNDYAGGLIGLESYNGGYVNSKVTAQIKFDNFSLWDSLSTR